MSEELPTLTPAPPWFHSRSGSLGLCAGGFAAYFIVGQVMLGVALGIWLVVSGTAPDKIDDSQIYQFLPLILSWAGAVAVAVWAGLRAMGWLAPAPDVTLSLPRSLGWTAASAAASLLLCWVVDLGLRQIGWSAAEQPDMLAAMRDPSIWLWISLVLIAPIGEELIFRRFLFSNLKLGISRGWAYILSAGLFALVHGNPSAIPLYLCLALSATYAYERTGLIYSAMAVHAINNLVAVTYQALPC